MKAMPARKKRRWVTRKAATRLPKSPISEIAFGVSRDSIRRSRAYVRSSWLLRGGAGGAGGGGPGGPGGGGAVDAKKEKGIGGGGPPRARRPRGATGKPPPPRAPAPPRAAGRHPHASG